MRPRPSPEGLYADADQVRRGSELSGPTFVDDGFSPAVSAAGSAQAAPRALNWEQAEISPYATMEPLEAPRDKDHGYRAVDPDWLDEQHRVSRRSRCAAPRRRLIDAAGVRSS